MCVRIEKETVSFAVFHWFLSLFTGNSYSGLDVTFGLYMITSFSTPLLTQNWFITSKQPYLHQRNKHRTQQPHLHDVTLMRDRTLLIFNVSSWLLWGLISRRRARDSLPSNQQLSSNIYAGSSAHHVTLCQSVDQYMIACISRPARDRVCHNFSLYLFIFNKKRAEVFWDGNPSYGFNYTFQFQKILTTAWF